MFLTLARLCRVVCVPCRLDSRIAGIGLRYGDLPNPRQVTNK
jgi:Tfp pilus assembly protein PilZ